MAPEKKNKLIYWIATVPFILLMLFSAYGSLTANEAGLEVMRHLGYPDYLSIILGVAKILGVMAILYPKFPTLKEWAYAGFTIDLIGASLSFIFVKDTLFNIIFPLIFLAIMFVSYFYWKRLYRASHK